MKDSILWLQLEPRNKSNGKDLYSSIKDLKKWIKRTSNLKTGERAHLFFQLLVEVNQLELSVKERRIFLQSFHTPIIDLIDKLSKSYDGSGLPLADEKSKFVEVVNTFWSEMATGYKIIIDDLSESSFFTSFIKQKDLASALYYVLFYLNGQLYSNYRLYSGCSETVWRDIHQVYRFASKRNLVNKLSNDYLSTEHTIADLYKKILLFSLANPYHLSTQEMRSLWSYLDEWAKYSDVNLNTIQVIKKEYPFIIKPYSDHAPFSNHNTQSSGSISDFDLADFTSDSVWGFETTKLIKQLNKKNKYTKISDYFRERLIRAWMGHNIRKIQRNELIEPVVIAVGVSSISQFLSQVDIAPKLLKLDNDTQPIDNTKTLENAVSDNTFYQSYLVDESKKGIRLKLNHQSQKSISPNMGEVIAIKHIDNSIQVGYLRWIRETTEGDIEFGIEYLSAMPEPVQLSKDCGHSVSKDEISVLDSFVFPGSKEYQFKPILFTHTFVEKFYNSRKDHLVLTHKTGSININLIQKVDEVLGYSLYLFEKCDKNNSKVDEKQKKSELFSNVWEKI